VLPLVGQERWVAVVDDDEMIRRSLGRFLRANGVRVRTFYSAQDYLSSVPDLAPACLILDMHLRDAMTGLELGEHLRAQDVAPPIIFITAQGELNVGPAGVGPDTVVLLRKPFEPATLLELVVQRVGPDRTTAAP
jgi:two-component system response regulator FixJ